MKCPLAQKYNDDNKLFDEQLLDCAKNNFEKGRQFERDKILEKIDKIFIEHYTETAKNNFEKGRQFERDKILEKIDTNKLLEEHNSEVEDYIFDRSEKARKAESFSKFVDKIIERITNFGYGNTTFHTADISLMVKCCQNIIKVEKEVKQSINQTNSSEDKI